MYDEVLTAAFKRLGYDATLLAEYLGSDWEVLGDLITDHQPGGVYRVQDNEIFLVWGVNYKDAWKECK